MDAWDLVCLMCLHSGVLSGIWSKSDDYAGGGGEIGPLFDGVFFCAVTTLKASDIDNNIVQYSKFRHNNHNDEDKKGSAKEEA